MVVDWKGRDPSVRPKSQSLTQQDWVRPYPTGLFVPFPILNGDESTTGLSFSPLTDPLGEGWGVGRRPRVEIEEGKVESKGLGRSGKALTVQDESLRIRCT